MSMGGIDEFCLELGANYPHFDEHVSVTGSLKMLPFLV